MNEQSEVESAEVEESIGSRLRQAREGRGMSIEELAARLRVPLQLVRDVERDCFERLGADVYVRGHLRATCRELSLSEQLAACYRGVAEQPTLQPMLKASLLDRLLEHSTRSLVYIVLTASIGIPVVWFALRSPQNVGTVPAQLARLDPVPVARPDAPVARDGDAIATADLATPVVPAMAQGGDTQGAPVVASLSGFLDTPSAAAAVPEPAPPVVSEPVVGALTLSFRSESWVEVRDADNRPLDEVLARSGDERSYPLGPGMRVVLGNASGVSARIGERALDLKPFQRANVARFAVSSQGEVRPDRD